jgi:hypothetical protein
VASFFNRALRKAAFLLVLPVFEALFLVPFDYISPAVAAIVVWALLAERGHVLEFSAKRSRFFVHLALLALTIAAVNFAVPWQLITVLSVCTLVSALCFWISPRIFLTAPMRGYSLLTLCAVYFRPLVVDLAPALCAPFERSTSLIAFRLAQPFTHATTAAEVTVGDSGLDGVLLMAVLVIGMVRLGDKQMNAKTFGAYFGWALVYAFVINAVRFAAVESAMHWLVPTFGAYGFFAGTRGIWARTCSPSAKLTEATA